MVDAPLAGQFTATGKKRPALRVGRYAPMKWLNLYALWYNICLQNQHVRNIEGYSKAMPGPLTPHDALIYIMVTMSAVDREMTDKEMLRIGQMVQNLPAFRNFDIEQLVATAEACGNFLSHEDGLDRILKEVAENLPRNLRETAYALAVEVAAADLDIKDEELRFLQLLRDALELEPLICAAIERGARARHHTI